MSFDHMPPASFLDDLLYPLLFRAKTSKERLHLKFKDRAAELLVEKLDLKDYVVNQNQSRYETTVELNRCLWIDQTVLNFFDKYPTAIGVNLNCGLSTRFHRISQQLEWPRFRWADIDTQDTISFNRGLLPNLDNYRAIGCESWFDDWLPKTGWSKETPVIIIIEDLGELQSSISIDQLFEYLERAIAPHINSIVHLVIDFPSRQKSLVGRILEGIALFTPLCKGTTEQSASEIESWIRDNPDRAFILDKVDLTRAHQKQERRQQTKRLTRHQWNGLHIKLKPAASDTTLKL